MYLAAHAGVHSTREPLPARALERPLVLPKGWTELTSVAGYARARRGFDGSGEHTDLEVPFSRGVFTSRLRFGVAPGWELWAALPLVVSSARTDQVGFGTATIGTRLGLGREAPSRSVAVEISGRLPLGYSGGSLRRGRVPLSTGTPDLVVGLAARLGWNGLVLDGRIEGWRRFGGRPGWADRWVKPGDELHVQQRVRLQAGPVWFGPDAELALTRPLKSEGEVEAGSGGWWLVAGLDLGLQLTRAIELELGWSRTLAGEDDTYVLLPDVDPALTTYWRAAARVRW